MSFIMTYRLEGFINGTLPMPQPFLDVAQTISSFQLATWIQYDSHVKSWIYSLASQRMNVVILGGLTARAKWLALEDRFTNPTRSRVIELRRKLQSLSKNNLSIGEYLLRTKTILNHLASTGEVILERELVLYILNGLDPRYLSFVTSFNLT